jgi:hypothetical protein
MAKRVRKRKAADRVLGAPEETVLDVLDHLLNKGVMLTGDVTLGVAGVELIYLRLSALLCAADRVMQGPIGNERRIGRRSVKPPIGYRKQT